MRNLIDSSVLIAAMIGSEEHHQRCLDLILKAAKSAPLNIYQHGIAETFSTLTGGKKSFQLQASFVADVLENDFIPKLNVVPLPISEMLRAMREAQGRGVRGGGIYDYLHLVAARKAKARRMYTLNLSNFRAWHRAGDPEIVHPGH